MDERSARVWIPQKVYAFDVDETLEISGGPIPMNDLLVLHQAGNIVGLCGNWAALTRAHHFTNWYGFINFLGSMAMTKAEFLKQLSTHIPASEYVMVGNILGVTGSSDDQGSAAQAGWRFISERDFAGGAR